MHASYPFKFLDSLSLDQKKELEAALAPALELYKTQFDSSVHSIIESSSNPDTLKTALKSLKPWRKGPFKFDSIHIDSEWQCQRKWDRIPDKNLLFQNKRVLDVGCGNGYYLMRMHDHSPKECVGIDPTLLYFAQFLVVNHFNQLPNTSFLPIGFEAFNSIDRQFDTILNLGLLYHKRDPVGMLKQMKAHLSPTGTLVLETIVIPGNDPVALVPKSRYAKMRNVHLIPTITCVQNWLHKAKFRHVEIGEMVKTTEDEQRVTEWSNEESLKDFLDPSDPKKTIEGYPAPHRVIFICKTN